MPARGGSEGGAFNSLFEMRDVNYPVALHTKELLSILYLRCALSFTKAAMAAAVLSFNSLFEMQAEWIMRTELDRLGFAFNSLFEMPGCATCPGYPLHISTFNSLFEMPYFADFRWWPPVATSFNSLFEMP